jgi:hypothetical protein
MPQGFEIVVVKHKQTVIAVASWPVGRALLRSRQAAIYLAIYIACAKEMGA